MLRRMSLLVVVAFLSASCGGTDAVVNPTQPSPTTSALSVAVGTYFTDCCRAEDPESLLPLRHAVQRAARRRGPAAHRGERCRHLNPRAVCRHIGRRCASSDVACAGARHAVRERTGAGPFRAILSPDGRDRLRYRDYGECADLRRDARHARTDRNGAGDRRCPLDRKPPHKWVTTSRNTMCTFPMDPRRFLRVHRIIVFIVNRGRRRVQPVCFYQIGSGQ